MRGGLKDWGLVWVLADFASDPDQLVKYLAHVGFDIEALSDPSQLSDAYLGHYRLGQGTYDTDRATMDLATLPPVSRRIFELQEQRKRLAK